MMCLGLIVLGTIFLIKGMTMETLWGIGEDEKKMYIGYGVFMLGMGIWQFSSNLCMIKTKIWLYENSIQLDAITNSWFSAPVRLNVRYSDIISVSVSKYMLLISIGGQTYLVECADNDIAEKCKFILEEKRG